MDIDYIVDDIGKFAFPEHFVIWSCWYEAP